MKAPTQASISNTSRRRYKRPKNLFEAMTAPPESRYNRVVFRFDFMSTKFRITDFICHYASTKITDTEVKKVLDDLTAQNWFFDYNLKKQKIRLLIFLAMTTTVLAYIIFRYVFDSVAMGLAATVLMPCIWVFVAAFLSNQKGKQVEKGRQEKVQGFLDGVNGRLRAAGKEYYYKSGLFGGWVELRLREDFFEYESSVPGYNTLVWDPTLFASSGDVAIAPREVENERDGEGDPGVQAAILDGYAAAGG